MTKKDYELIARVFAANKPTDSVHQATYLLLASELAFKLKLDNPRFDRTKFLQACGVEPIVGINWEDGTTTIKTADKGIVTMPTAND